MHKINVLGLENTRTFLSLREVAYRSSINGPVFCTMMTGFMVTWGVYKLWSALIYSNTSLLLIYLHLSSISEII